MKRFGVAFAIGCFLLITSQAHALVEIRASYGINSIDPKTINNFFEGSIMPQAKQIGGIGVDGLFNLPSVPIGFGVRYENETFKASAIGLDYEIGMTRIGLLVNYRIIDSMAFFGPIASVGLSNSGYLKGSAFSNYEFKTSSGTSFSIGAEGGVKLGMILIGAELGYLSANLGSLKYQGTTLLNNDNEEVKFDMSGLYGKILLGVAF